MKSGLVKSSQDRLIPVKTGQVNLDQVMLSHETSGHVGVGQVKSDRSIQTIFGPNMIGPKKFFDIKSFGPKM